MTISTRSVHQMFAAVLAVSIIVGVAYLGASAAANPRDAKPVNVATQATVTATSEHSTHYSAARTIDGKIPAPTSRNDGDAAWAVNGNTHRSGAALTLTWKKPVVVAELVYYGRCAGEWNENWKDYEVYVDNAKTHAAKGTLIPGRGPQRIALAKPVTARTIRLNFLSSYGGMNPGASEIQVWSASPSEKALGKFVAKDPGASRSKKKAPPAPTPPKASPELRSKLLAGPLAGVEEVVFAARGLGADGHWYANFSYYAPDENRKAYGMGGKLARVNLRTGKVAVLVDDPNGTLRDPVVDYDGKRIVFCWRKAGTDHFNLYEIQADGTDLRQLTGGPWDDLEPAFLPDGDIIFVSSRAKRWVNCWLTQVAVLHRCDRDGRNIRQISANLEHDNTPWPLPDGRILYTRWEYVDRNQVTYHHLWTANPDGTNQMVYFGNMHPGTTMIDAKPIPGTDKIVAGFSPRHGRKEHAGPITIVDPNAGPDAQAFARTLTTREYRDPWAISETCFLAADGASLVAIDGSGATVPLYTLSSEDRARKLYLHEPRPLIPRPREQVIPPRTDPSRATGTLVLADVYQGRNMGGVKRGEIKKLLIIEALPKPINFTGGMEPLSYGGTFTLERVVGTVPVEDDGSAFMELPAMRSLFFVALDENDMSVKRMQSFLTVMPGETTGCVGCHENRVDTPRYAAGRNLMATRRSPSRVEPIPDVPDVLDFVRDVQPILDKHCLTCHDVDKRKGGVILSGDPGPMFPLSYFTLTVRNQFADGRNGPANRAPRTIGSSASPLLQKLLPTHNKVQTTERERKIVRLWIETGAAFPGTYAALGSGMVGGYAQNKIDRSDLHWPSTTPAMKALQKRCGSCHKGTAMSLPMTVSDNRPKPPWVTLSPTDARRKFSRHLMYNLARPDKSLILLAPLARAAGGYGMTVKGDKGKEGKCIEIFADTSDKDYQAILAHIRDAAKKLNEIKRFHMPGFRPQWGYVREMKRYGILPASHKDGDPVDVYATDRAYWKSLWYVPKSE